MTRGGVPRTYYLLVLAIRHTVDFLQTIGVCDQPTVSL